MTVAACLKLVDHRPEIDQLSGEVSVAARSSGASEADLAALEWALRLADARAAEVLVLTAGPRAAESMLRDALAAGAARAIRVDLAPTASSEQVAAALAAALPVEVDIVVCGDWSTDRGSGSVPAYLAAHRGAAQALGLVSLRDGGSTLTAERRLDGGRRERLRLRAPLVLSVEGASARLRRASLDGVLRARTASITTIEDRAEHDAPGHVRTSPYRPRARVLPAPKGDDARDRIFALTGALADREPPQRLVLEPVEAADRILEQLRRWGYLE
ncbi:MAG: mycofactocin-associated electron transfer flavoprotein beta subunit [Acidimicrobiales bacterium]